MIYNVYLCEEAVLHTLSKSLSIIKKSKSNDYDIIFLQKLNMMMLT